MCVYMYVNIYIYIYTYVFVYICMYICGRVQRRVRGSDWGAANERRRVYRGYLDHKKKILRRTLAGPYNSSVPGTL